MRFSLVESMCDPAQLPPLARAAEAAGFATFLVPDSICYPEVAVGRYPYNADGSREFLDDKPFLEPFSLIPALAAVTGRLRFATYVLRLPVRNPVLVAKSAASVAVLSGNRLALGVGLSPWVEDFQVCGQDWKSRGRRMDEMIEIVRGLVAGGWFAYRGAHYDLPRIKISPVPSRPIPILIGGHSEVALRRAARLGDGFMHAGLDAGEQRALLRRLRALLQEHGRGGEPFEVHAAPLGVTGLDGFRELEELGVTDCIVGPRNPYDEDQMTLEQKLAFVQGFADQVIAKLR
jgi:probable F420-dependent oxidoreductase